MRQLIEFSLIFFAADYPSVYARVSYAYPFIREQVCALSSDPPAYLDCPTSPPTTEVDVTLQIQLDSFPEQVSWSVTDNSSNQVVYEEPSTTYSGRPRELVVETLLLTRGQEYTLRIGDTAGDGLCCSHGDGQVLLFYGAESNYDQILAYEDGRFASSAEHIFVADSLNFVAFDGPTAAPSMCSTGTSIKPSSASGVFTPVTLLLHFDTYPIQTGWRLTAADGLLSFGSVLPGDYDPFVGENVTATVLVPLDETIVLTMLDSGGNGMCCDNGNGFAVLYWGCAPNDDRVLVVDDGVFSDMRSWTFVASANQTFSLSSSLDPPSSSAPSVTPVDVTVEILLDAHAHDIGWEIVDAASLESVVNVPFGTYGPDLNHQLVHQTIQLQPQKVYFFLVRDMVGDGLLDNGYGAVYFGPVSDGLRLAYQPGNFGSQGNQTFVAAQEEASMVTSSPTSPPTVSPTAVPTMNTAAPTTIPTVDPTTAPTFDPTARPTTHSPTFGPTTVPTAHPTTPSPTIDPTLAPTTAHPTTLSPTIDPTLAPTVQPTASPTIDPTLAPTFHPTAHPTTLSPTLDPTTVPTLTPTTQPTTHSPTVDPTCAPSVYPTTHPTTHSPTVHPTAVPTFVPTTHPTAHLPTRDPSTVPIFNPTANPAAGLPTTPATFNPTANPISSEPTVGTITTTATPTTQALSPSVAPSKAPSPSYPKFCLSALTTVTVQGMGSTPINQIEIGDMVLTRDNRYETVYSFGHRHPSLRATFLQIHTQGPATTEPLEQSAEHMVFLEESGEALPALALRVGDTIQTVDLLSETCTASNATVTKIVVVERKGVYAPFTPSGSIVVNGGLVVSTFVALSETSGYLRLGQDDYLELPISFQWLAWAFEAPHRIVCQHYWAICESESYNEWSGISQWVNLPLRLSEWWIGQHPLLMGASLVPLLVGLWAFVLLETVVKHCIGTAVVLFFLFFSLVLWQAQSAKQKPPKQPTN